MWKAAVGLKSCPIPSALTFHEARAAEIGDDSSDPEELEALARSVVAQFETYVKLNKKVPPEVLGSINQIDDHAKLADTVASHLAIKISEKQELLGAQLNCRAS